MVPQLLLLLRKVLRFWAERHRAVFRGEVRADGIRGECAVQFVVHEIYRRVVGSLSWLFCRRVPASNRERPAFSSLTIPPGHLTIKPSNYPTTRQGAPHEIH